MARRLSTSRSVSAPPAQENQVYEVECTCGETIGGRRESQAQTLTCPHCGTPLFVLPADCYSGAAPRRVRRNPPADTSSGGLIEKLNRLAFWTRLRESRRTVGQMVRRMGRWVKRRLNSSR